MNKIAFIQKKVPAAASLLSKPAGGFGIMATPKVYSPAISNNDIEEINEDEAEYEFINPSYNLSDAVNLIPSPQSMKGSRLFISAKYFTQALPQVEPEAPLVDSLDPESGQPYSLMLGKRLGMKTSGMNGKVTAVMPDYIEIQGADGKKVRKDLYNFFPHARKTFSHDKALVQVGQEVTADTPIARSNYVTDDGTLALGKNLRVAFMAAPGGSSFEDSIAVSESASRKMTSSHMYGYDADFRNNEIVNKSKYVSLYPGRFTAEMYAKFGDNGVVKPGTIVQPGDPIILSMKPRLLSSKDSAKGNIAKLMKSSFEDRVVLWDKPTPGRVTDVVDTRNGPKVNIVTDMPLRPGDKVSARQGAKGVVGSVIPDEEMPRDKDGNMVDIFINPAALIGRVNPAMVYEAMLGKIATRTGKRYAIPSFTRESSLDFVKKELAKNGVSPLEEMFDPQGRKIGDILVGNQMFMKLEHSAESKLSARDEGGMDMNEQPTKGGKEGAKRVGGLMTTALLGHDAKDFLKDVQVYRGSGNPEVWANVKKGLPLPAPKIPFVYEKYLNILRGAGLNVRETNDRITVTSMTDRDVDELKGNEVKSSATIDEKNGKPVKGGLFDYALFGGPDQKGWGYVKLDYPVPNPVMEDSLREFMGITKTRLRDIISGKSDIEGKKGPDALKSYLKGINLEKERSAVMDAIRGSRGGKRDGFIKKLTVINGLMKAGMAADEMLVTKIPVIPPAYRPAAKMGDVLIVSDANYLYKDLLSLRDSHRRNREILPLDSLSDERLAIYDAVRAVNGFGDPVNPEHRDKGVKGFMKILTGAGKGPKTGFYQSKVIGHPVNAVGRSVIIPDARLDMDQVGIPEKMAWKIYEPFTMGRMVRDGMAAVKAREELENHTEIAKRYLLEEMKNRPVAYTRDPALHKFNIMGANPVLVTGDAIRLSPLVVKPFNADFDGDQMNIHLPMSNGAIKDIRERMMPSKNLFSITRMDTHFAPSQEFILGIYNATRPDPKKGKVRFKTRQEAVAAYRDGRISIDTPIEIG